MHIIDRRHHAEPDLELAAAELMHQLALDAICFSMMDIQRRPAVRRPGWFIERLPQEKRELLTHLRSPLSGFPQMEAELAARSRR